MSDVYIPKGAVTLDTTDYNFQIRLGLQGPPGTSKTWASTTFPNPAFISFDRGLVSHVGRKDIVEIPFYDPKFVDSIVKRDGYTQPPNRKEAITKFLEIEALKFSSEQTCVVDGSTGLQSSFHSWWETNKMSLGLSRSGEIDARKEWNLKLRFFDEIVTSLKALKCNVIYIAHEAPDRDDKGNLNGQVRPLLTGQFQDQLQSHFSDWFRCLAFDKPTDPERYKKFLSFFQLDDKEASEWLKTGTKETIYVWQTQADQICKCKTSLINCPKYILASYESFKKYQRKNS